MEAKLKILLSSALMDAEDMFGQYKAGGGAYLPHGLLSIAAIFLREGHHVTLCDPYAMNLDKKGFCERFAGQEFDLIGLGNCYTSQVDRYFETARLCKELFPQTPICIGGAHPTIFPRETLERCPSLDYLISGEGEMPLLELATRIENHQDISEIAGLTFREGGSIRTNPQGPGIEDPDSIPIFPYELLPMDRYVPPPSNYKRLPTYGLLVQRGCPYRCVYCDSRIHGRRLRQMSVERTIREIEYLRDHYGMKGIIFHDSIFTVNRKWMVGFCNELISKKLNIQWTCYTRADAVDEELCRLMKAAGCWSIAFGIESANQESLDRIRKNIKVEEIIRGIRAVQKAGLEVIGSIILCLPGEDERMVMNTIRFTKKMNLDIVVFFMPVPFPGTELYDICKEEGGLVDGIEWRDYRQWMDQENPLYINPKIGREKMQTLYKKAFRTFYLSPKYLWRKILAIRTVDDLRKYFTGFVSLRKLLGFTVKSPFLSMRD